MAEKPERKQKSTKKMTKAEQSERFKETARKLGADESGEAFEQAVARIIRRSPPPTPTVKKALGKAAADP